MFLEALALTGNVTLATGEAGVDRHTAYNARRADKGFRKAWAQSLSMAADLMEAEARRRGVEGTDEPVIYQGKLCGSWVNDKGEPVNENTPGAKLIPLTIKQYSDTLLIFLMKAARPKKYRENVKIDHGGTRRMKVTVKHTFSYESFSRELDAVRREREAASRRALPADRN